MLWSWHWLYTCICFHPCLCVAQSSAQQPEVVRREFQSLLEFLRGQEDKLHTWSSASSHHPPPFTPSSLHTLLPSHPPVLRCRVSSPQADALLLHSGLHSLSFLLFHCSSLPASLISVITFERTHRAFLPGEKDPSFSGEGKSGHKWQGCFCWVRDCASWIC